MVVLPPGFGWSVGDVAKLINFTIKIYDAFNDPHTNSKRQYQQLAHEINRFREVLELLKETLADFGQSKFPDFEDVKSTLDECAKFLAGYEVLIEGKKSIAYVGKTLMYTTEERNIKRLQKNIAGHVQFISLYIDHLKLRAHSETREQFRETHRRIDETQRQTERILSAVRGLSLTRIPSMPFIPEQTDSDLTNLKLPESSASSVSSPPSPNLGISELDDSIADLTEFIRMLKTEEHPLTQPHTSATSEIGHPILKPINLSTEDLKTMHAIAERMIERAENSRKRMMNLDLQRKPLSPPKSLDNYSFTSSPSYFRRDSAPLAPKDLLGGSPKATSGKAFQPFNEVREPSTLARNKYSVEKLHDRQHSFDTNTDSEYGSPRSYAESYISSFTNETGVTTPRMWGSVDSNTPKQRPLGDMATPRNVSVNFTIPRIPGPTALRKHSQEYAQIPELSLGSSSTIPGIPGPPATRKHSQEHTQIPELSLGVAMLDWKIEFSGVRVFIRDMAEWDESLPCNVAYRHRESGGLSLRTTVNGRHIYHDFHPPYERLTIPYTAHTRAMQNEKLSVSFKEPQRMCLSGWNSFQEMMPKYIFASDWDHKEFQQLVFHGHQLIDSWNINSITSDHDPDGLCRTQTLRLWRERDLTGNLGVRKIVFFANLRAKGSPWVIEPKSVFDKPTPRKEAKLKLPFLPLEKHSPRNSRLSFSSSSDAGVEEKKRKYLEIEFANGKDRTHFLTEWTKS